MALSSAIFLFRRSDSDRKGLCAARAAHGVLALLARQAQRRLAFRAIAEHVRIGILIAVMPAEQAAHLIFKGAPLGVLCLSFINLARKGARHAPDAKTQCDRIQNRGCDGSGQGSSPYPGHGERDDQHDQRGDR